MPHVIVKMYAGRAEAQKHALAEAITGAVTKTRGYGEDAVSVSIEDVAPKDWTEKVYKPDIAGYCARLQVSPRRFPRCFASGGRRRQSLSLNDGSDGCF